MSGNFFFDPHLPLKLPNSKFYFKILSSTKANTGHCSEINECFEDSNEEVRCGPFLLRESQWNAVQSSAVRLRQSNEASFDRCFSSFECSSDLVNAYTLLHFVQASNRDAHMQHKLYRKNLTCADIAFFNQFGHSQAASKIERQYSRVLQTHQCMARPLNDDFQARLIAHLNEAGHQAAQRPGQSGGVHQFTPHLNAHLSNQNQIGHLNLPDLPKIFQRPPADQANKNDLSVSIVPRRCFDCIRTANNYNSQNSEQCIHPQLKCGPYAINFEYFTQVNGNLVAKRILPKLYNTSAELDNQNHLLDTLDLLNKVSSVDNNKQFRKDSNQREELKDEEDKFEEDYKMDYNRKLSQLLDFDYSAAAPVAKAIYFERKPKRKNSKLLSRLVSQHRPPYGGGGLMKSRRNSKFSRELHETDQFKSVSMNEELSVQKLISTASYQNFVNCAANLQCAEQLVNLYVKQHLVDCNLDSTIDCDDFASLHWLGKKNCKQNTMLYSNLWKNFEYCSILADDVRREELAISDELAGNDKNYYELAHGNSEAAHVDVPIFQARPSLQPPNASAEPAPHSDLNQYYSGQVVDLSNDCLQCICEASSEGYNCSQILNAPSNFYFSAYKIAPPPQIVYLKTNNRMPKTTSLNTLSQMNSLKRNLIKLMRRNSDLESIVLDDKFRICEKGTGCGPFAITKQHFLESMINTFWYRGAAGDWVSFLSLLFQIMQME